MHSNGEMWLQRQILELVPSGQRVQVLDVGANVGRWSTAMLLAAGKAGRAQDLHLHAFEPSAYTFARLSKALSHDSVVLEQVALGDRTGVSTLHVIAPGAGTNSLHELPERPRDTATEQVDVTTLDSYANRAGLGKIMLVKVDAEGHDLAVLRGAARLMADQRIFVAQFEYNQRWIYSRSFLRDVFEFVRPFGYHIGKLTSFGVEFYSGWDSDLETFVEGNYVACRHDVASRIPSVRWWKSDR
jgi:FkbM family methyltransferase